MRRLLPRNSLLAAAALLLVLTACQSRKTAHSYYELSGYAQGGLYSVRIRTDNCDRGPEDLKRGVDSILNRIDTTLSGYNPASQLSRFNAGEPIRPDELFLAMYERAYGFFVQSEGVLDFAAGPVFDAWGFGFTEDSLPSDETVAALVRDSGMKRLRPEIREALDADGILSPAALLREGVSGPLPRLNYNAIAQGWSCDLVAEWLRSCGATDFLVNIGEIYCEGVNPRGEGWTVGVDRPEDGNFEPGEQIEGIWNSGGAPCGIVTSGNYRKFYLDEAGNKYVHTIDPRTGYPVRSALLSATVVAPDGATADALATWCMVIGKEASEALIESLGEPYACFLIYDKDGTMYTAPSSRFQLIP